MRFNRNIARALIPSDLHSLGTNADNESVVGAGGWLGYRAGKIEALGGIR